VTFHRLGTLTIGQAPRGDIMPIIERHLPDRVERQHAGLLDGFDDLRIDAEFGARDGERVLVTRLRSGRIAHLSAAKVERAIPRKLLELERAGCDVVLLLCTGAFHAIACERAWLVEPDRTVPGIVAAMAGSRMTGIVVPLPAQMETERGKWALLARPPLFAAANPYDPDVSALLAAGRDLRSRGAELIVLDCIGFVEWHRARLAEVIDVPVLLSSVIVAVATAALF
jgi:protein AroM